MASDPPRLPENYRFVHDLLKGKPHGTHWVPAELLAEIRRTRPRFGYATLYRALGRLRDAGLIAEVTVAGAEAAAYEAAAPEHAHFRCTRCGRIDDVSFTVARATVNEIAARQQVAVAAVTVTFSGTCASCRTLLRK